MNVLKKQSGVGSGEESEKLNIVCSAKKVSGFSYWNHCPGQIYPLPMSAHCAFQMSTTSVWVEILPVSKRKPCLDFWQVSKVLEARRFSRTWNAVICLTGLHFIGPWAGLFQVPSRPYFDLSWVSWASWQCLGIKENLVPKSHAWTMCGRCLQCFPSHPVACLSFWADHSG